MPPTSGSKGSARPRCQYRSKNGQKRRSNFTQLRVAGDEPDISSFTSVLTSPECGCGLRSWASLPGSQALSHCLVDVQRTWGHRHVQQPTVGRRRLALRGRGRGPAMARVENALVPALPHEVAGDQPPRLENADLLRMVLHLAPLWPGYTPACYSVRESLRPSNTLVLT